MEKKVLFPVVYAPHDFTREQAPLNIGASYQVVGAKETPTKWGSQVQLAGFPNELFPKEDFVNAREYKIARMDRPWAETDEEIEKILTSQSCLYHFQVLEEDPQGNSVWVDKRTSHLPIINIYRIGFNHYIVVTRSSVYWLETR